MSRAKRTRPASQPVIPENGYVRVAQLLGCRRRGWVPILPVSRSGLYGLIRSGRFPAPQKIGTKIIAWPVEQIRETLAAMRATNN
jgi:prophage regulatory protein